MKQIPRIIFLVSFVFVIAVNAQTRPASQAKDHPPVPGVWREVSSSELGFSVEMPNAPTQEKIRLVPDDRRFDLQVWKARGLEVICQVITQHAPAEPTTDEDAEKLFKALLNGVIENAEQKLESEKEIEFEGHPGREFKVRMPSGISAGRAYIIGKTIVVLMTFPLRGNERSKEIDKFLDSFKLIERAAEEKSGELKAPDPINVASQEGKVSYRLLMDSAVKKVQPEYPAEAKAALAEGAVSVKVTISDEGKVVDAEAIEGHSMLRESAVKAAKQWEFKPIIVDGKPAKVTAFLTFNFVLQK